MTKLNKFLALLPVVAFAAGCNGVAPGGPNAVASNDASEFVSGGASTMSRSCDGLKAIELAIDESDDSMLWVKATYVFASPFSAPCPAPSWRSDRDGLTVDPANAFRAGFFRLAGGKASLQATGPNGVHNLIDVNLDAPSTSLVPIECDVVTAVILSLVPTTDESQILVRARYEYDVADPTFCTEPPTFVLDRRGLTVDPTDPFLASIVSDFDVRSELTATGPGRVTGSIVF